MRTWTVLSLLVMSAVSRGPRTLQAQFQMPLPSHLPDTLVHLSHRVDCVTLTANPVYSDTALVGQKDLYDTAQDARHPKQCVLQRVMVKLGWIAKSDQPVTLLFGGSSLSALDQLGGGFAGSNAYVYSSLIAGNAGDFRFNLTFLRSSSRKDSAATDTLSTSTLRRSSDRVTQLIMNGGEATGRFLMPHWATGGVNWQSSWGSYLSFGLLGTVRENEPLPVAVSAVTELQTSLAIRQAGSYGLLGDIYLAARPGLAYVFGRERLVAGRESRWLPYVQASVGIRTTGKLRYGVLYTLLPGSVKQFLPQFQLVAQTTLAVALKK